MTNNRQLKDAYFQKNYEKLESRFLELYREKETFDSIIYRLYEKDNAIFERPEKEIDLYIYKSFKNEMTLTDSSRNKAIRKQRRNLDIANYESPIDQESNDEVQQIRNSTNCIDDTDAESAFMDTLDMTESELELLHLGFTYDHIAKVNHYHTKLWDALSIKHRIFLILYIHRGLTYNEILEKYKLVTAHKGTGEKRVLKSKYDLNKIMNEIRAINKDLQQNDGNI